MEKRGLLVVLSGPAGSGKSTLAEGAIEKDKEIIRAVTATTRDPRPGEQDGVDYYFLSRDEFESKISEGGFVEYTTFNNNYYGTPRAGLEKSLEEGKVVFLVIDVKGSEQLRKLLPHAVHVFVLPPSRPALRERLCGRGTECPADIESRLAIAENEVECISGYDYLVINDKLEAAVEDLLDILHVARKHHIRGGELQAWQDGCYQDWHKGR